MLCGFMFFEMKDFGMGFLCYFICRYVKVLRSQCYCIRCLVLLCILDM